VEKTFNNLTCRYPLWIIFILSIGVFALYYPALDSGFILDDFYNLRGLEDVSTKGYAHYVFSGIAGASGRPLSLLTFALQHNAWLGDPFSFKLVNLIIHIINGVLIYCISGSLAKSTSLNRKQIIGVQILAAFLWLVHPMHISTVLYAVQRMTQLAALFMLLGVASHLYLRQRYAGAKEITSLVFMGLSLGIFTAAAVLCKENGILLPLYIIVIEATILSKVPKPENWRRWTWVCLYTPLIILLIYLLSNTGAYLESYQMRAFTPIERLLTEAVVLKDYFSYLLFPHPDAFSIYHDDYPISSGILSPPPTLISIVIIAGVLILSICYRSTVPVFSFSMLWFLSGHILESTFLPLELYFEHRNYLPSFGLFFMLVYYLVKTLEKLNNSKYVLVLFAFYFVMVSFVSVLVINVWSNPHRQSIEWARIHPTSPRAIENLGSFYLLNGEVENALKAFAQISKTYPNHIYPHLKKITIQYCIMKEKLSENEWQELFILARNAKLESIAGIAEIDSLTSMVNKGKCEFADIIPYMKLMLILANNPEYAQFKGGLHELLASLAILVGDGRAAVENIRESVRLTPTVPRLIYKVRILIAMEKKEEAEQTLKRLRTKEKRDPRVYFAYHESIAELEKQLYK
jgi:protein O-mannosyl-transferase